jgi:hypothetical protein
MNGEDAIMEPVPEVVRQSALRAFDLRVPNAVLADLVYDPLLDGQLPEAPNVERVLEFRTESADGASIAVRSTRKGLRLSVALVPPTSANVELRGISDSWQLTANAEGRLVVEAVPSGLVSLVIRRGDARPIQTSWVRI